MTIRPGTIVLIPIPFTNLEEVKLRPALVMASHRSDLTVLTITSKLNNKSQVNLKPTHKNGLRVTSGVQIHRLATIQKNLSRGKLGMISQPKFLQVKSKLSKYLGL